MNEKYITDTKGRKISVILPIRDYREMLDKLEELEDLKAFDVAISGNEQAIPAEQAFAEVEAKRHDL
ncbi:MAG: hypothetical protein ACOC13_01410 [Tangfeifania sp.]